MIKALFSSKFKEDRAWFQSSINEGITSEIRKILILLEGKEVGSITLTSRSDEPKTRWKLEMSKLGRSRYKEADFRNHFLENLKRAAERHQAEFRRDLAFRESINFEENEEYIEE